MKLSLHFSHNCDGKLLCPFLMVDSGSGQWSSEIDDKIIDLQSLVDVIRVILTCIRHKRKGGQLRDRRWQLVRDKQQQLVRDSPKVRGKLELKEHEVLSI